ncbi:hypothetical protein A2Z00_03680 [Candidatus Gottesmanbacteria bacterium RBG_13_45_10]|uniref:Uncharacterized protein n=1 Tax=Candidatus Gottesmanbacteria bacterium RBG_13_45_10 TaxID=1798370 RepID=A0A1F5ZGT0_9BACT|nr:MAG: hypothetical protein A2Z00_03680 [Candidatus Gottesmanbacteria bacterium RBG_13_45_10]
MLENLETYAQKMEAGKIDGRIFEEAESLCNSFAIHDPAVTLEMAQRAAIIQMQAFRESDRKLGTHSALDQFAIDRLISLRVDPNTLQILR